MTWFVLVGLQNELQVTFQWLKPEAACSQITCVKNRFFAVGIVHLLELIDFMPQFLLELAFFARVHQWVASTTRVSTLRSAEPAQTLLNVQATEGVAVHSAYICVIKQSCYTTFSFDCSAERAEPS